MQVLLVPPNDPEDSRCWMVLRSRSFTSACNSASR